MKKVPDRAIYLATEQCGCFVGVEPTRSDLLPLWMKWKLKLSRVSAASAELASRTLFCEQHKEAA